MADFIGTTSSNDAKIKKGKEKELQAYIDENEYGDATPVIENGTISVYGYDWVTPYARGSDGSAEDAIDEVSFFKGLAPFIAEPLTVQMIGATKCRFPLSAWEIKVWPSGKVQTNGFKLD